MVLRSLVAAKKIINFGPGQPGKKLLFMGGEFGQWSEWYREASLDWHLLDDPRHAALQRWVEDLNRVSRQEQALFTQDFTPAGFEWVDCNDVIQSVITFLRKGRDGELMLVTLHYRRNLIGVDFLAHLKLMSGTATYHNKTTKNGNKFAHTPIHLLIYHK